MEYLKDLIKKIIGLFWWTRKDVPLDYSYFKTPAFEKELRSFNRELSPIYHGYRTALTLNQKTKARLYILGKWRDNFIKELRQLNDDTRRMRVHALTVESWRCDNFIKLSKHLEITKRDMELLGEDILKTLKGV